MISSIFNPTSPTFLPPPSEPKTLSQLEDGFWNFDLTVVWFVILVIVSFGLGLLAKRLVRMVARKRYETEEAFLGSTWDLAAPVIQLFVTLFLFTAGAEFLTFDFGEQLVGFWPKVLAALVIIAGAVVLTTWINRSIRSFGRRAHASKKMDDTLIGFSASIIRYVLLGIAILMAMTQLGIAPGSLIAIVGAVGLAIALALQDTLKAVAAGFMIAAFRPFRIGDWVKVDDLEGEVADITPFTTTLNRVDNTTIIITNDRVWGNAVLNYTRPEKRRVDLYFDVHYDTDLDKALEVLAAAAISHELVEEDKIWTGVHNLKDWSVQLRLRAWIKTSNYLRVRSDVIKLVKEAFDEAGIVIPYPHQVELVHKDDNSA